MNLDPALVARIAAFHNRPGNEAGGRLHIVLDDGNLADDHIAWCVDEARKAGDAEAAAIGEALLALGPVERWWAREMFWDHLHPGRPTPEQADYRADLRYWRLDTEADSVVCISTPYRLVDAVEGTSVTVSEVAEADVAGLLAGMVASGVLAEDDAQIEDGAHNALDVLGVEPSVGPDVWVD